ncbi:hypothetical protein PHMEG_00031666 [Phytophthora megakarya]|uniref:Uncharacterized protein n=1 Tax=Phytophthora megakarya TaxID=4795 RepID=A0A225UWB1_9STRA|nr:hypothetical protein PHMEG_00031666 [Phytophthora megakarya]
MEFGQLVNKWQIFKGQLLFDFVNINTVIKTCMKLRNLCIDEQTKDNDAPSSIYTVIAEYNNLPESWYQTTYNSNEPQFLQSNGQGRILREVIMKQILRSLTVACTLVVVQLPKNVKLNGADLGL